MRSLGLVEETTRGLTVYGMTVPESDLDFKMIKLGGK